jgi:hypothetical protein
MNGRAFRGLRRVASLVGVIAAAHGLLGMTCGPITPAVNAGSNLYVCDCFCGFDSEGVQPIICADDAYEAESVCSGQCNAVGCTLGGAILDVIDYEGCYGGGGGSGGAEGAGYKVAGGIPNSSEASLSLTASHATLSYFGHGPTTIGVGGDVMFTGGCERDTCPISFNLMYFTPDDFAITEIDNTQIQVTDVFILNDGDIDGLQTDGLFTIPRTQIRLLVNGYMNGLKQSIVFSPAQDVSGVYVPSTGQFRLSAHFSSGTSLDLQLDLQGTATSRPPVADAGPPQEVTADSSTQTARVTLDGSGSSDLDGDLVEIAWFEGSAYLGSGTTVSATFGVGAHTVRAVAFDAAGKSNSADTTVTVLRP